MKTNQEINNHLLSTVITDIERVTREFVGEELNPETLEEMKNKLIEILSFYIDDENFPKVEITESEDEDCQIKGNIEFPKDKLTFKIRSNEIEFS